MSKDKYSYYRGKSSKKKSYRYANKNNDDFKEIKDDVSKLCFDIKKFFNLRQKRYLRPKPRKNDVFIRNVCLGTLAFVITSFVLTLPIAVIVFLCIGCLFCKKTC